MSVRLTRQTQGQEVQSTRSGRIHKTIHVQASRKGLVKSVNREAMKEFMNAVIQHITDTVNEPLPAPFRFSDLPAEVRNIVYDLSINVDGINKFLDAYYLKVKSCTDISTVDFPDTKMHTPSILLVSRQTYLESRVFLGKKSLTFTHGLFDCNSLQSFVRPGLLHNLCSIEINDTHHPVVASSICSTVLRGYARLIENLSEVLRKGHKLKSFTLTLTAKKLKHHTTVCWFKNIRCGYRDLFRDALNSLRAIRGVDKVTFGGLLPQNFCNHLKAHMEGQPHAFTDFPSNVRQLILQHTTSWADLTPRLTKLAEPCTDAAEITKLPLMGASPVMFTSQEICSNATKALFNTTLTITFPKFPAGQVPHILELVSADVLQAAHHLRLVFHSMSFTSAIRTLVAILKRGELRTLAIEFTDPKRAHVVERTGFYPDQKVHRVFSEFLKLSSAGLESVSIDGDLPLVYSKPLCDLIVKDDPNTTNKNLPLPMSVRRSDGLTVPVDDYFADPSRYRKARR